MPKEKNKKVYRDVSKHAAVALPAKRLARGKADARDEIRKIQLTELRKKLQLNQTELKGLRQADVSKIENRPDMKLSTLVKYVVEGLGVELEIKVHIRGGGAAHEEITLFRELPSRRRV